MKLMTTGIEAALVAAASNGEKPPHEKPILVKVFTPDAQATLFITEGSRRDDGELVLFGLTQTDLDALMGVQTPAAQPKSEKKLKRKPKAKGKRAKKGEQEQAVAA